ncbi:hypothetical protein L1887_54255 [Cichorium endivia]|nr:hypothetical protein L1887_62901 [Cichorium endivia]KAI3476927.1 hypothetical protein L1887_61460 [Cichorium endivia]KAI3479321.1 hypothetical protein L1887_58641 [Cichorium endivia]KAI3481355.1 hypothetical protein L1887_56359 [Cichorium endivia]KAI3482878.1 hypothetical protein L1887_54255 [Cichorium endivia]
MKGHLALYARQPVPLPTTCSRARIEICDSSSPVRSIKGALARWAENASFCPNAYAFRCMLELLFLTTCLRTAAS